MAYQEIVAQTPLRRVTDALQTRSDMHAYANPARFLKLARPATVICGWLGAALIAAGVYGGLFVTPADYLQGESVRIMYIHVPTAWLSMAGWSGIAISSLMQLVWRHPLAGIAARACALPGAVFTAICLATGSIWGRPTWGTWWEWDGRMTSVLILFFLYLGYMALASAGDERDGDNRVLPIFGLVGAINIPVIRYSVDWWNSLHQTSSISVAGGSKIASELLWPLGLTALGFTLLFATIVLMRMRSALAHVKVEARLRRLAAA